ncbi:MAG: hypothetical protein ACK5MY_09155 [Jhaorihella sp.]
MRGLHVRKGSDVWQGRFRIPANLWRQRERLKSLGVKDLGNSQEFSLSTGEHDRDEAGVIYVRMLAKWNAKLKAWEELLANGPKTLSFRQELGLAAEHAKSFLATYDEDPFSAPPEPIASVPNDGDDAAVSALIDSMQPIERQSLYEALLAYHSASAGERWERASSILQNHPAMAAIVASEPPRVYRRVKHSKDEPNDEETIYPRLSS